MKLVRDRIRLLPNRIGEHFKYTDFDLCIPENYEKLLFEKLKEERHELDVAIAMVDTNGIREELVDHIEVLIAIGRRHDITREQLLHALQDKYEEKGGFEAGVILVQDHHK